MGNALNLGQQPKFIPPPPLLLGFTPCCVRSISTFNIQGGEKVYIDWIIYVDIFHFKHYIFLESNLNEKETFYFIISNVKTKNCFIRIHTKKYYCKHINCRENTKNHIYIAKRYIVRFQHVQSKSNSLIEVEITISCTVQYSTI